MSKDNLKEPPLSIRAACISNTEQLDAIERQLVRCHSRDVCKVFLVQAKELNQISSQQQGMLQLFAAAATKDSENIEPEPGTWPGLTKS